jgi:two-component SAPR family response regulator
MPNINGFDLYDAVSKIDNKVKAFFLTAFGEGYTEEFERRFPVSSLFSDISFIRKPIRMDDLVKKVNEVI